jgi:hypothetical protein
VRAVSDMLYALAVRVCAWCTIYVVRSHVSLPSEVKWLEPERGCCREAAAGGVWGRMPRADGGESGDTRRSVNWQTGCGNLDHYAAL